MSYTTTDFGYKKYKFFVKKKVVNFVVKRVFFFL